MKVEKLFKQLKREFWKINTLQACLDSITFFLGFNLILFLFSIQITGNIENLPILVGSTAVMFGIDLAYRSQKYNIEIYEEKNPELNEILRTAKDNIDMRHTVSQALFEELMERSKDITSESIVPSTKILQKIFLVGALSFLTVLSGLADFQISEVEQEVIKDLGSIEEILDEENPQDQIKVKNASDIMGEEKDIPASENLIDYEIKGESDSSESGLGDTNLKPGESALSITGPDLSEDLELAKQYSLSIRSIEQD